MGLIKRKHQEQMNEINNHLDALSKAKMKAERESKGLVMQVEEFRKENENLAKTRVHKNTLFLFTINYINIFQYRLIIDNNKRAR